MQNVNRTKLNTEAIDILNRNNRGHIYQMWEYEIGGFDLDSKKNTKKFNYRFTGNEIFAFCLMVALFSISFGGSYLIRQRTQQKLIYNSIPQVTSNIRQ